VSVLYSLIGDVGEQRFLQTLTPQGETLYPDYGLVMGILGDQYAMGHIGNDILVTWSTHAAGNPFQVIRGHLISEGQFVWQSSGVNLAYIMNSQELISYKLAADYLVWEEANSTTKVIYVKKINSNGGTELSWQVEQLEVAANMQLKDIGLMGGYLFVLMQALLDPWEYIYPWYVQKISPLGEKPWGEDCVLLYNQGYENFYGSTDFAEDYLTTLYWQSGWDNEFRLARIDTAGNNQWGYNGMSIGDYQVYNSEFWLHLNEDGIYTIIWNGIIDNSYINMLLCQFDPLGSLGTNTIQVLAPSIGYQRNSCFASEGNNIYVTWEDSRNSAYGNVPSLYGACIFTNGSAVQDENLTPLSGLLLMGNKPNPFKAETGIKFELGSNTQVSLQIYNIKGQLVRNLANGKYLTKGENTLFWDGCNDSHSRCGSGVYFYRINTPGNAKSGKMLLLH